MAKSAPTPLKIAVYAICLNEERFVDRFMAAGSVSGRQRLAGERPSAILAAGQAGRGRSSEVERQLPKLNVAGSIPAARSNIFNMLCISTFRWRPLGSRWGPARTWFALHSSLLYGVLPPREQTWNKWR
jgi:hypothetical protein